MLFNRSTTNLVNLFICLVLYFCSFLRVVYQVTARGGRPVLICEEGDSETQRLNPDNCLTIPHTVDCLQVGDDNMSLTIYQWWRMVTVWGVADQVDALTTSSLCFRFCTTSSQNFYPQGILSVIPLQLLSYHMAVLK